MFKKKLGPKKADNMPVQQHPIPYKPIASKACHEDGTYMFRWEAIEFYAGRYVGINTNQYDLIIDMSLNVKPLAKISGELPNLANFVRSKSIPILSIQWPDYGVISWNNEDYKALLRAIRAENISKVYICCYGGHGRTGTLLSIIAAITGNVLPDQCPVGIIREKYCQFAVESQEQIAYIELVTGFAVTSQISKSFFSNVKTHYGDRALAQFDTASIDRYTYYENYQENEFYNRPLNQNETTISPRVYDGYYEDPKASL